MGRIKETGNMKSLTECQYRSDVRNLFCLEKDSSLMFTCSRFFFFAYQDKASSKKWMYPVKEIKYFYSKAAESITARFLLVDNYTFRKGFF